jgi:pyrroline-5-carboxylate reductase
MKRREQKKSETHSRSNMKLAILGCGKMGTILLQALLQQGLVSRQNVRATVQHADKWRKVANQPEISIGSDNREAADRSDVILICVKPQAMLPLLDEIAPVINSGKLVISIAASVPLASIRQKLPDGAAVVRAMPNTPAMVGSAMTAICADGAIEPKYLETARRLFESVGRVVVVDEKHMDAVTGLAASGPAFAFVILESLAEAGVKVGLPRELATMLAAQTLFGSAQLVLETGHHPALLKDAVTTPAGCTIDGIMELEKGRLRVTLMNAVVKATQRAKELVVG